MARHRRLIVYLVACLIAVGSTLRYVGYLLRHPSRWIIFGLLAALYALLALAPWVSRRSSPFWHIYLAAQTGILLALAWVTTIEDVVALPFLALILLAMTVFAPRIGFRWIAVFVVLMLGSMAYFGIAVHGMDAGMILFTALVYLAGYLGMGLVVAMARQIERSRNEAEEARKQSEALLAELQSAHEQLRAYTAQAEELAVTRERNRLARELHDSVTQTLFTMTLTVQSSRILLTRDLERAKGQLDKLHELARSALGEMRALIYELRPTAVAEHGLVSALRHHLVTLQREHGLSVAFRVSGESHLHEGQAHPLFRIAQEALNNVVKHAETDRARVTLRLGDGQVFLEVQDHGKGFMPEAIEPGGAHIGLSTMRERAEHLGGTLRVDSHPGQGTRVLVEIPTPVRNHRLERAREQA